MQKSAFITFLVVVLSIYALINTYNVYRGWSATAWMGWVRYPAMALFLLLILMYPAGRFLEASFENRAIEWMTAIGAYYLAIMIYLFVFFLAADILRLGNHFLHFFPSFVTDHPERTRIVAFWVVVFAVCGLIVYGHWNAFHSRVRPLEISIHKKAPGIRSLTVVVASDWHIGKNLRNSRLETIVEKIKGCDPDLVLLPGDILDEDLDVETVNGVTNILGSLKAPYGVFASTGNHEYFVGVKSAVRTLEKGNIRVLRDEAVKVEDAFYLVGRNDPTARRFGETRKPLTELIDGIDTGLPVILLDHQPFNLGEAERNGVDLQVSGHTHNGQFFPLNLVTRALYERSWGYLKKGRTHYYVSCGVGVWGPPVRIGSVSEIVVLRLTFDEAPA